MHNIQASQHKVGSIPHGITYAVDKAFTKLAAMGSHTLKYAYAMYNCLIMQVTELSWQQC